MKNKIFTLKLVLYMTHSLLYDGRYSAHWQARPFGLHENETLITSQSIGDNQYWSCFVYDITSLMSACLMFYPGTFREKVSVSHGLFSIFGDFGLRLTSLQESKVSCIGNLPPTPHFPQCIFILLLQIDVFHLTCSNRVDSMSAQWWQCLSHNRHVWFM